MGTWRTAIFSDDLASDLKEEFKDLIGEGKTSEEATDILIKRYQFEINDSGSTVFWISLAATQWQLGRLLESVKKKAIEIIKKGEDLKNWQNSKEIKKREIVLKKLEKQLLSPQPTVKKVAKHFKNITNFEIGDVISYKTLSNNLILFRVIGFHDDKGGRFPIYELLDWIGKEIPSLDEINNLPIKIEKSRKWKGTQYFLGNIHKKDYPPDRVKLVLKNSHPAQKLGGFTSYLWPFLDSFLKEDFNIT